LHSCSERSVCPFSPFQLTQPVFFPYFASLVV
jgi:hypothetical protein